MHKFNNKSNQPPPPYAFAPGYSPQSGAGSPSKGGETSLNY